MTLTDMKGKIQAGESKVCENEAQYKGSFVNWMPQKVKCKQVSLPGNI